MGVPRFCLLPASKLAKNKKMVMSDKIRREDLAGHGQVLHDQARFAPGLRP
jgi:hypothetical protein